MTTHDPIKHIISPLLIDAFAPFSSNEFLRPPSTSSTSSSETLCDAQPLTGILLIFPEKGKIVSDELCRDPAQPSTLPSPHSGCTSGSSAHNFENGREHLLEMDVLPELSLGLTSAVSNCTSLTDIPLSPLYMPPLPSFPCSMNYSTDDSFTLMTYPSEDHYWSSNIQVYSARGDDFTMSDKSQAQLPITDATGAPQFVVIPHLSAPQPKPATAGGLPFLYAPPATALGLVSEKSRLVAQLERRAREREGTTTAPSTHARPSPLDHRQDLPSASKRPSYAASPLSRPSEYALLRTPLFPTAAPFNGSALADLLRDDTRSGQATGRIDSLSVTSPAFSVLGYAKVDASKASSFPTPGCPRQACADLPEISDTIPFGDYNPWPVANTPVTSVPYNDASSAQVHWATVFPPTRPSRVQANQEEADHPRNTSRLTKGGSFSEEHLQDLDGDMAQALRDVLSQLQKCANITFPVQRRVMSCMPLNYDSALLCRGLNGVLFHLRSVLLEGVPFLVRLPDDERSWKWLRHYRSVISSLQRNIVNYLHLALLISQGSIGSRNIDRILDKLGQYDTKFQDISSRLMKLHNVGEILIMRSRLEASRLATQRALDAERGRRNAYAALRKQDKAYRHELREQIRSRKRAIRSRTRSS
ncbi:unnamed protein product [Somion occarium]|uniref:Uncharacterized protein n=1 Tax=Somion occarium TaxID=3059160 RepID=A0ABP1DUG6_9APHY